MRGLRSQEALSTGTSRIIPARAGFTRRTPTRGSHPGGSSPRVRGLLAVYYDTVCDPGIIPARAGFTDHAAPVLGAQPDHPRACGVYIHFLPSHYSVTGSSPRVRGLRIAERKTRGESWIIPARAGFTRDGGIPGFAMWDHPRACGVYNRLSLNDGGESGSSPRVRGLLVKNRVITERDRIIPARAGFTGGGV